MLLKTDFILLIMNDLYEIEPYDDDDVKRVDDDYNNYE